MGFVNAEHLSKREIDLEIHVIMLLYHDLPMSKFLTATKRIDELRTRRDELEKYHGE